MEGIIQNMVFRNTKEAKGVIYHNYKCTIDGVEGEISFIGNNDPYAIGDTISYEIEDHQYGPKIRKHKKIANKAAAANSTNEQTMQMPRKNPYPAVKGNDKEIALNAAAILLSGKTGSAKEVITVAEEFLGFLSS